MRVFGCLILLALKAGTSQGLSKGQNEDAECKTQPVNAAFVLDGTTNVQPQQRGSMLQFIVNVIQTLPAGSDGSCAFVNDVNTDLLTFKSPTTNTYLTKQLENASEILEAKSRKIVSNALEKEVQKRFTVSAYKKKAEIFYLIVTDVTDIDNFPVVLLKKKVFITVLGTRVPDKLNDLASSEQHVHVISDLRDVRRVADLVAKQTCIDSRLKCDVDQYMEKRSKRCKSCMSVCSSVTNTQSDSCMRNCPYIQIPPKAGAVKTQKILDHSGSVKVETHNAKGTTIIVAVTGIIIVIVVVVVYVGVYIVCRRRKLACDRTNPREINPDQLEMQTFQPDVPESNAVQETGNQNEQDAHRLGNDNSRPLLDGDADCTRFNHNENTEGFNIPFKNNRDLDTNGHVFGGSEFKKVH